TAHARTPVPTAPSEGSLRGWERGPAAAAVLTGYERYFSGGLALTHIIDYDIVAMRGFIEQFSRAMTRVFACSKPIVAAVNGHAIAGGCVLALMCDLRIAVDGPAIRIGLNEAPLRHRPPAIRIDAPRLPLPPP